MAQAQAQGVVVSVSYSGPGYDPLQLTAYAALDNDPWQITATRSRQVPQVTLSWPGTLTPPEDGSGHLACPVTLHIQFSYVVGRESVLGRTAVTITP